MACAGQILELAVKRQHQRRQEVENVGVYCSLVSMGQKNLSAGVRSILESKDQAVIYPDAGKIRCKVADDIVLNLPGIIMVANEAQIALGIEALFAFDAGQELSEHTAPYDALLQVLDGVAEVSIAGQPYRLMTGDSIIMPSHDPHAVKAVTQFKMMLTMVRS